MDANQQYRDMIKEQITKICSRNQNYSLRAFARDYEISPSQLSRVLAGQKNLSLLKAKLIADKLFHDTEKKNYFLSLVEYCCAKNDKNRQLALKAISENLYATPSINLTMDQIQYMSNWYHLAILHMVELEGFKFNSKTIAKKLSISEIEAKLAVDRLINLRLLEKDKNGQLNKTHNRIKLQPDVPSQAIRNLHKQLIYLAEQSIENQTMSERILMGKTMAIHQNDIKEVESILKEAMDKIGKVANRKSKKNKVYQLNLQLFNLIKE